MTETDKKHDRMKFVRSINFDPGILKALDRKADLSGLSRSSMTMYALAQMLGIPYEPKRGKDD